MEQESEMKKMSIYPVANSFYQFELQRVKKCCRGAVEETPGAVYLDSDLSESCYFTLRNLESMIMPITLLVIAGKLDRSDFESFTTKYRADAKEFMIKLVGHYVNLASTAFTKVGLKNQLALNPLSPQIGEEVVFNHMACEQFRKDCYRQIFSQPSDALTSLDGFLNPLLNLSREPTNLLFSGGMISKEELESFNFITSNVSREWRRYITELMEK